MASYLICIENHQYCVDITDHQILVDGKRIQASVNSIRDSGLVLLRSENRVREFFVIEHDDHVFKVTVKGKQFNVGVEEIL